MEISLLGIYDAFGLKPNENELIAIDIDSLLLKIKYLNMVLAN